MQPNEDIGESHPPSLNWTQEPCKAISHVVLGRGKPGGSWHDMQSDAWSLSTGRWLQLPIYQYEDWQREEEAGTVDSSSDGGANVRVTLGSMARYYEHYVEKMGISKNFRNGVTVTQVQLLGPMTTKGRRSLSCESTFSSASLCSSEPELTRGSLSPKNIRNNSPEPMYVCSYDDKRSSVIGIQVPIDDSKEEEGSDSEIDPFESAAVCNSDDTGISCCAKQICLSPNKSHWVIRGRKVAEDGHEEVVCVCAKNIVLATGVNDAPKKLKVPGEDLDYVCHAFSGISLGGTESEGPVLVVGAGLSAADAVIHTLSKGLTVIHAFHQDTSDQRLIYHSMDPKVYSEYVKLFQLMCSKCHDPHYIPLAQHRVEQFNPARVCTLYNCKDKTTVDIAVSRAVVLIGGQAKLDFLPECLSRQLGLKPDQPIESKRNPMDIDAFSFEAEEFPSLFAMGPLAGDNFVRFVLGGAIGITKKLRKNLCK